MFRNIRKFVTLYLSLNPYDRVKTCVVPTFLCLFVFFISLSSQHGNSQKQVIGVPGSYEQKGCILKVVGKESIDNKGNISTVRFVDRELDSKCLLTVIGRRQVSVSYLNFDLNHRPRLSGGTHVIVYFVRSRGGGGPGPSLHLKTRSWFGLSKWMDISSSEFSRNRRLGCCFFVFLSSGFY